MFRFLKAARVLFHHWMAVGFEGHSDHIAIKHVVALAELGDDWGLLDLGNRYSDGQGIDKDLEKAFDCYRRSAEVQGQYFKYAAASLGRCYFNGDGVPICKSTARSWYEKSASAGLPESNEALDNFGAEI